jgi:hypothetical protein
MNHVQLPADLPRLPRRSRDTSKRDYGRVLVVGGSAGMAGAPALASQAALRSGAGLVEMVVPEAVVGIAATFDPCVMTRGLAAGSDGTFAALALDAILERARIADAVAVVAGFGFFQFGFQAAQMRIAVDGVFQRRPVQRRGFLGDVGDAPGSGEKGIAGIGLQFVAQQREQAGFAGAVHARELAEAGHDVRVLDRRPHIGGNAFDEVDANGVRVHRYGPHLFHTRLAAVAEWVGRFADWVPYEHRVRARLEGRMRERLAAPISVNDEGPLNLVAQVHDSALRAHGAPL